MKKIFILSFALFSFVATAQDKRVTIGDFVTQHEGLKENPDGEIVPINDREINKKIRFFIEEKYINVEFTRNIIWDSYETFISPYDRHHSHTFIVQVKVENHKRLKYLEIKYDPNTLKVDSAFEWDEEVAEFEEVVVEEEVAAINS
ncbi:MAG: hypothetical protein QNL41_03530 [Flavobacteriaceae bacterium]